MNHINFTRLWKKVGGKWVAVGDLTNGSWQISKPGKYKKNCKTNGWWGTASEFEITEADLERETWTDDFGNKKIGHYGNGILVSA